jgi:hypothetical protein
MIRPLNQRVDHERDYESERRYDPNEPAAMLVGLGHHRVREHGEDCVGGEREDKGDGIAGRVLEEARP